MIRTRSPLISLPLIALAMTLFLPSPARAQTELISVNRDGTATGNNQSTGTWFSADGRYIVFVSYAKDLVEQAAGLTDIYIRDRQLGTTTLVSVSTDGTAGGNGQSLDPTISADGRYVTFESYASDLVANDTNGSTVDVFVRDLEEGVTTLVSVNADGTGSANGHSQEATISADGRHVLFESDATDLAANDTNGHGWDIFLRDLDAGVTHLVTRNTAGGSGNRSTGATRPTVSADGAYVAFASRASDLIPVDANGNYTDVFRRDVHAGTTTLVSVNLDGQTGRQLSDGPLISADGNTVVFTSSVDNLVPDDTNHAQDVFVRDMGAGETRLVSVNHAGTGGGRFGSRARYLTPNGRFVVFTSMATDLVAVPKLYGHDDVFVRDLQTGTTMLASVNHLETAAGNEESRVNRVPLSDDGRFVAFASQATDLVETDDTNEEWDVFARDLQEGVTTLISVNLDGTATGNAHSAGPSITADGRLVGFTSNATDLVDLDDGNFTMDAFVRALNQPPSVSADGPYEVDEGSEVRVVGSGDDPEARPLVYDWDLDDDGVFESPGQGADFSAVDLDGPSTHTIVFRAEDEGGAAATSTTTVDVLNVAPTATLTASATWLIAGECSTLGFTDAFDPGTTDTAAGFLHSFDCTGDGTFERSDDAAAAIQCGYPVAGSFAAVGRIADKDGGASEYSLVLEVMSAQSSITGAVIEVVEALVATGILTQGEGNAVISTAEAAIQQLNKGNLGAALNILSATSHQIEAFVQSGRLPAEVGQQLLSSLDHIVTVLEGVATGEPCQPTP